MIIFNIRPEHISNPDVIISKKNVQIHKMYYNPPNDHFNLLDNHIENFFITKNAFISREF